MVAPTLEAEEPSLPKRNTWADYVFRPLLLTVMLTCISISLVAVGRAVSPDYSGGRLLAGMILTTIESIYSFRLLRLPKSRGISLGRYRLAELGTLALLLKLISYTGRPFAEILAGIEAMIVHPGAFFSMDYIVLLVMAGLAWAAAQGVMLDFETLYDPYTFRTERIVPMERLAGKYYWGGAIIIVTSGLSLVMGPSGLQGLAQLAVLDRPRIGGVVINALVYFVLGLLLLSQVRLTTLMTRWTMQKVNIADGLGQTWARYGLAFLALVAALVIFLPTGYSLGVFETAMYGVGLLMQLLMQIAQLLMFLITLPIAWLASLFGGDAPPTPPSSAPAPPPPIFGEGGESPPWYEILRSLVFWSLFACGAYYLITTYLADNPELIAALKRLAPLRWLINLVGTLVGWIAQLIRAGMDLMPKKVDLQPQKTAAKKTRKRSRWRRLIPGRLSAREQILYYYLNTLQRAEGVGVFRKGDQTPYEFESELGRPIPEAEPDVSLLTQAFVHARYSNSTFDSEHVAMVKSLWQRVRTALKSGGDPEQIGNKS